MSTHPQTPFRGRLSAAGAARNSTRRKLDFGRCECDIKSLTPPGTKVGVQFVTRDFEQALTTTLANVWARARFHERVIRKNPPLICLSQMNFVDVVKVQECFHQSVPIGENCLLERRLPQGSSKQNWRRVDSLGLEAAGGKEFCEGGSEIVAGLLSIA